MDHLLSSSGGEHILVPYVGVEEYDRDDFKTYRQRKGWSTTERGDLISKTELPMRRLPDLGIWAY